MNKIMLVSFMKKEYKAKNPEEKKLRKRFNRRYLTQEKRAHDKGMMLPNKEELWNYLNEEFNGDFTCEYCDRKLFVIDYSPLYPQVFSLDHRVSIDSGGTMETANFAIVCNRCNILKSTMSVETYKKLIDPHLNNHGFLDQVYMEIWRGRYASQRDRWEK